MTKAGLAVEVSAVLALAAAYQNDRVGALLFADEVERVIPPRKGRRHALRVIRDLVAFTEDELLKVKNVGEKALAEIRELLEREGLTFGLVFEEVDGDLRVRSKTEDTTTSPAPVAGGEGA